MGVPWRSPGAPGILGGVPGVPGGSLGGPRGVPGDARGLEHVVYDDDGDEADAAEAKRQWLEDIRKENQQRALEAATVERTKAARDSELAKAVEEARAAAAVVESCMLLARGEEYAGAEHDVEEGVVGGGDAPRPNEEGAAVVAASTKAKGRKLRLPAQFMRSSAAQSKNGTGHKRLGMSNTTCTA